MSIFIHRRVRGERREENRVSRQKVKISKAKRVLGAFIAAPIIFSVSLFKIIHILCVNSELCGELISL
jgi:hypothetical protein